MVRQRFVNGSAILAATNDSLFVASLPPAGYAIYWVVVSNVFGSITSAPVVVDIDSDADGLPDWWETAYFGNLGQTGAGDFDGDGVSNFDEQREGTDPSSNRSYNPRLRIQAVGGTVLVSPTLPYYIWAVRKPISPLCVLRTLITEQG
jgi:hypothetical protein